MPSEPITPKKVDRNTGCFLPLSAKGPKGRQGLAIASQPEAEQERITITLRRLSVCGLLSK